MKKYNRQRLILDLIENNNVQTQEELSELLKKEGVEATQATISRDIKELRITKIQLSNGLYKYTVLDPIQDSLNERLTNILRSAVLSVHHNENLIIIQTVLYCAAVCGMAITNAKIENIEGMVTGMDTIFVAVDDKSKIDLTVKDIQELLK
ncbi:arginine repressor [Kallipyga gabonensis]|uniref:arginine repressor n=1 Tax=Kallipyga gabonensis TaxID=1686287 RepID=UPI0006B4E70A|nr:arginine repressor [Kallipyga gabonensis]